MRLSQNAADASLELIFNVEYGYYNANARQVPGNLSSESGTNSLRYDRVFNNDRLLTWVIEAILAGV